MENELNIKWNRFDKNDSSTYPPEDGNYLVTLSFASGKRDSTSFYWLGDSVKWGKGIDNIIYWAKITPCTESEEEREEEVRQDVKTVTLRELSRHPYELDVDALIAVKNALKKKLEWLESSYQEDNYIDSGAKSSFLFHCAVIETRFEKAPEIVPHDDLCYMYNDMIKRFMRIHPFFKECTNSIEITIEW